MGIILIVFHLLNLTEAAQYDAYFSNYVLFDHKDVSRLEYMHSVK